MQSHALFIGLLGCGPPSITLSPHEPAAADTGVAAERAAIQLSGDEGVPTVVVSPEAASSEVLAGKEVRRYVYLRTGSLLPLVTADTLPDGDLIVVAEATDPLVADRLALDVSPGGFFLYSSEDGGRTVLTIAGADPQATLHGAYRFAEHLGVGFGLDGDAIPDARIALQLDGYDEAAAPILETRGLLPFHDFPSGPDFWSTDDYVLVVSQMSKLGLNLISLHTYPRWSTTEEAGL